MDKVDIKQIIKSKIDVFLKNIPSFLRNGIYYFLFKILHIDQINYYINELGKKRGVEAIDEIFEYVDFKFSIDEKIKKRIPKTGKLICVSNHPLGGLDGLALMKTIAEQRNGSVKMLANELLMNVKSIEDMFIPVDVFSSRQQKSQLIKIKAAIENEEAIIIFPAGRVSRLTFKGIRDRNWTKGAVYFASKFDVPVLPIYVKGRNALNFYIFSLIWDKIGTFLLPHQLFRKNKYKMEIIIGDLIPSAVFSSGIINHKDMTRLLMRHVYRIGKGRKGILKTEKLIIDQIADEHIIDELSKSEILYESNDNKKVFLVDYNDAPNTIKEISRLRELAFRKVGAGTGQEMDTDKYDRVFKHLVLWDEINKEIMGSYRIGLCNEIVKKHGPEYLYNTSLFNFYKDFNPYLDVSIELGRSFIQHKYWKSNALDLLWKGIGSILKTNPHIRFLFGSVSMSDTYPEFLKFMMVYYYKKWYSTSELLVKAKDRFEIPTEKVSEIELIFKGNNFREDFFILKNILRERGYSIPVLYRSYIELCKPDGVKFLDFAKDKVLGDSVAGFMLLELDKLEDDKKLRYFSLKKEE